LDPHVTCIITRIFSGFTTRCLHTEVVILTVLVSYPSNSGAVVSLQNFYLKTAYFFYIREHMGQVEGTTVLRLCKRKETLQSKPRKKKIPSYVGMKPSHWFPIYLCWKRLFNPTVQNPIRSTGHHIIKPWCKTGSRSWSRLLKRYRKRNMKETPIWKKKMKKSKK